MQVMLMRLMSKGEYLIVPRGTKFTGAGKLGLSQVIDQNIILTALIHHLRTAWPTKISMLLQVQFRGHFTL